MKPNITSVINVFPEFAHIQWTIEDPNGNAGAIEVLRSTSPDGPFETVAKLPAGSYYYRDMDPGARAGLTYLVVYRIRVESSKTPGEFVISEPRTLNYDLIYNIQPHRARLGRTARYNLKVMLERVNGTQYLFLKKKLFGPRCSVCFNQVTQDAMVSRCGECFGTTITGGYCDPIKVWIKVDPGVIKQTFGLAGSSDSNVVGGTMLDYPQADPGDLLVECSTNKRFLVAAVMRTENSGVTVHQDVQMSELVRYAIEYSIPVKLI